MTIHQRLRKIALNQLLTVLWSALTLLMVFLSPAVSANSPEADEILKQRVNQYLQALSVADMSTAYRLERDAQGAQPKDPFQYMNEKKKARRMSKFVVESIQQQGDSATAYVQSLVVTPIAAVSIPTPYFFKSHWVRMNGNWFHVADEPYKPDWLQAELDAMAKEEAARNEDYARRLETAQQEEAARKAEAAAGTASTPAVPMTGARSETATQP